MISAAVVGYSFLGIFAGYVTTSIILLNFPGLLHKKKKTRIHAAHISHRGGSAENLENTMQAFRHAVNEGTDMLEMDVVLSKDGEIVVCHDEHLERLCAYDGDVSQTNYKDLPALKNELGVLFYDKHTCKNTGDPVKMPKLEEVFNEFPNTLINIEIKGKDERLVKLTSDLIKKYKREKTTLWGFIDDVGSKRLHKENPEIPICFSMRRSMKLVIWFYTGLLPFMPIKETHFEILLPECYNHNVVAQKLERLVYQYGGSFLKSKRLYNHLKKRGIPTYLWVVNYEEDFQKAFDLGVEGVMTDCPAKLSRWLNDHPQYKIK